MSAVVVSAPGNERLARDLVVQVGGELATTEVRRFPDGEIYVRIDTPVAGRDVIIAGSLDQPSDRFLPIAFLAATARDLGAKRVGLVAPYLGFMRQDHRFVAGEGITSTYFATMLSSVVDWIVTVDPHLHRWPTLDAIYRVPSTVVASAPAIAEWIKREVPRPLLIGPDAESVQWVEAVAKLCDAPFVVLEKTRRGDRDVSVSPLSLQKWPAHTPVIIDDIVSTARTMIEAVGQVHAAGGAAPTCIAIHGVFVDGAFEELQAAKIARVVTCETVEHASNGIAVTAAIGAAVRMRLSA